MLYPSELSEGRGGERARHGVTELERPPHRARRAARFCPHQRREPASPRRPYPRRGREAAPGEAELAPSPGLLLHLCAPSLCPFFNICPVNRGVEGKLGELPMGEVRSGERVTAGGEADGCGSSPGSPRRGGSSRRIWRRWQPWRLLLWHWWWPRGLLLWQGAPAAGASPPSWAEERRVRLEGSMRSNAGEQLQKRPSRGSLQRPQE
jgi:hypothetical protein